jgi:hypothetical protein
MRTKWMKSARSMLSLSCVLCDAWRMLSAVGACAALVCPALPAMATSQNAIQRLPSKREQLLFQEHSMHATESPAPAPARSAVLRPACAGHDTVVPCPRRQACAEKEVPMDYLLQGMFGEKSLTKVVAVFDDQAGRRICAPTAPTCSAERWSPSSAASSRRCCAPTW